MQPGDVVAGRFEIERIAGQGGMGAVYRAVDRHAREAVALKVLLPAAEAHAERFLREGALLSELSHPGIVRYVAHGRTGAGQPYLAMEWLDGCDLDALLDRGPLPPADAAQIALRIAEALGAAHSRGVVHRDVKPSNVFLVDGRVDRVKVLDFGIARRDGLAGKMTRTGLVVGTPAYMAPEQARGQRSLDARADVFSLGCVLYECLTGHAPFVAEHLAAVLAKVLFDDPPRAGSRAPGVPEALDALILRLIAKDPAGRPRDGAEAARAIAAVPVDAVVPVRAAAPRGPAAAIGAGEQRLVGVIMTGPVGVAWLPPSNAPTQAPARADDTVPEELDAVRAAAGARGARIELLADGSLLGTITGTGAASDLAAGGARLALDLRALLPGAPIALVTGRAVVSERWPVGEAIDAASRLLRAGAPHPGVVRLDDVTAGLLDTRFDVRRGVAWAELAGERDGDASARTLLGRPSLCFGRERELGTLAAILDECIAERWRARRS